MVKYHLRGLSGCIIIILSFLALLAFCTYPYGHLVEYHAVDDVENDDYKKSQEVSSGSLSLRLTAIRVDFEENEQADEW